MVAGSPALALVDKKMARQVTTSMMQVRVRDRRGRRRGIPLGCRGPFFGGRILLETRRHADTTEIIPKKGREYALSVTSFRCISTGPGIWFWYLYAIQLG